MTPKAVVRRAVEVGLDAIAICDHNSARNSEACRRAAIGKPLLVLPGIEITTREEVHILGIFGRQKEADSVQEEIYSRLHGMNDEAAIGVQVVVNEFDEVEDIDERLLIGATTLDLERVTRLIRFYNGLAIASHVDRSGFGIFAQLGFIPAGLELDALEVSVRNDFDEVRKRYRQAGDYNLLTSSDAHFLEDIGSGYTEAHLGNLSFQEIAAVLRNRANHQNFRQVRRKLLKNESVNGH